jgi:hypothetical protein
LIENLHYRNLFEWWLFFTRKQLFSSISRVENNRTLLAEIGAFFACKYFALITFPTYFDKVEVDKKVSAS